MIKMTMMLASLGLVTNIITMLPTNSSTLRKPIDTLVPTRVSIKVVSVVSRDKTSPVFRVSKNDGSCLITCE